jgi:hypothetical protein
LECNASFTKKSKEERRRLQQQHQHCANSFFAEGLQVPLINQPKSIIIMSQRPAISSSAAPMDAESTVHNEDLPLRQLPTRFPSFQTAMGKSIVPFRPWHLPNRHYFHGPQSFDFVGRPKFSKNLLMRYVMKEKPQFLTSAAVIASSLPVYMTCPSGTAWPAYANSLFPRRLRKLMRTTIGQLLVVLELWAVKHPMVPSTASFGA